MLIPCVTKELPQFEIEESQGVRSNTQLRTYYVLLCINDLEVHLLMTIYQFFQMSDEIRYSSRPNH